MEALVWLAQKQKGVIALAGAHGLMFPQKEVEAGQGTWLKPGSPWSQLCSEAQHPTMRSVSCDAISPLGKAKDMRLGATLIRFGE